MDALCTAFCESLCTADQDVKSVFKKKVADIQDISCLKHVVCRELVQPCSSESMSQNECPLDFDNMTLARNRSHLTETYPVCAPFFRTLENAVELLSVRNDAVHSLEKCPVSSFKSVDVN